MLGIRAPAGELHGKGGAPSGIGSRAGLQLSGSSGGRTRTCDPTGNSRLLYQLSYAGMAFLIGKKKKLPKARKGVNGRFGIVMESFLLLPLGFSGPVRWADPGSG